MLLICGIVAIPILLGISTTQAKEKVIVKIPKVKKEAAEPSKKSMEETTVAVDTKEKAEAAYFYDPINKIESLQILYCCKKGVRGKRQGTPKTYLETLDISQLIISAIVLGSKGNWALVRDSKGDGHVIKVGTLIGKTKR